jgi:hypothetical protein
VRDGARDLVNLERQRPPEYFFEQRHHVPVDRREDVDLPPRLPCARSARVRRPGTECQARRRGRRGAGWAPLATAPLLNSQPCGAAHLAVELQPRERGAVLPLLLALSPLPPRHVHLRQAVRCG